MRFSQKERRAWINANTGEIIEKHDVYTEHAAMILPRIREYILPTYRSIDTEGYCNIVVHQAVQLGYIRFFANRSNRLLVGQEVMAADPFSLGTFAAFECLPCLFTYCQDFLIEHKLHYEFVYFNNTIYDHDEFICAKKPRR